MYEIVLQDVKAAYHLREDEYFVTTCFHFRKQFINKDQFTSRLDHCLEMKIRSSWIICISKFSKYFLLSPCQKNIGQHEDTNAGNLNFKI